MKTMRKTSLSFLTIFTVFLAHSLIWGNRTVTPFCNKPAVVFDLGGVLFETDSSVVKHKQLGIFSAARFAVSHFSFSSNSIKNQWFRVLQEVQKNNEYSFTFHNEDGTPILIKDEHGTVLPDYMVEWMCGNRSNEEIFEEIKEGIMALPFLGARDKNFMINLSKTFLSEAFVASRKIIPETVALLTSLKKKGYPLYILSNWDKASFELMMKKYPEIFSLFDGYIVSGFVHLAKPDIRIYQELEKLFPHAGYIFIDDQKDNIATAQACGWNALKVSTGRLNKKQMKETIALLSIAQVAQNEIAA